MSSLRHSGRRSDTVRTARGPGSTPPSGRNTPCRRSCPVPVRGRRRGERHHWRRLSRGAPLRTSPHQGNENPGTPVESRGVSWRWGGIEPPSDGRPRGLLRAQSASYFSAPDVMQTCLPDGLSQLSVEADPLTRSTTSGSLNDARIRAGSTTRADGLKVQTAIRQQERSRCDSVRHLLVCTHRSRAERASSTRFPSIDDRRRNRSSPIEFFNPPPPVTRWWTPHDTRREHAGQWPTGAGGEWRWRGIEPPSDAQPGSDGSPRRTVDFSPNGGTVPPPLGKKSTSRQEAHLSTQSHGPTQDPRLRTDPKGHRRRPPVRRPTARM